MLGLFYLRRNPQINKLRYDNVCAYVNTCISLHFNTEFIFYWQQLETFTKKGHSTGQFRNVYHYLLLTG